MIRNCQVVTNEDDAAFAQGGGIRVLDGSPRIIDCEIIDNFVGLDYSGDGGGLYLQNSFARVTGCTISDNVAMDHISSGGWGGAAYVLGGAPNFTDCTST